MVAMEDRAKRLQRAIDVLLVATPPSPQHMTLCEEQAAYLCQKRDEIIAQMAAESS
jgi:hypothetical protein